MGKKSDPRDHFSLLSLNNNGCRQLFIDAVAAILDGEHTAAPTPGNNRHRLAAVTAKGKEKGIQVFVIGFDALDDVFPAFRCCSKRHMIHQLS